MTDNKKQPGFFDGGAEDLPLFSGTPMQSTNEHFQPQAGEATPQPLPLFACRLCLDTGILKSWAFCVCAEGRKARTAYQISQVQGIKKRFDWEFAIPRFARLTWNTQPGAKVIKLPDGHDHARVSKPPAVSLEPVTAPLPPYKPEEDEVVTLIAYRSQYSGLWYHVGYSSLTNTILYSEDK